MLKAKKGFILRKLGTEYMVVAIGEASKAFNGMVRMNETAALYWKELEQGATEEQLVQKTMECYADVDEETARQDIREFLNTVAVAIEDDAEH